MRSTFYQAHHLLWVKDIVTTNQTSWYEHHNIDRPVVVRRAKHDELIPVGIRGEQKTQRLACWVKQQDIIKGISAIEVAKQQQWLSQYEQHPLQQFKALKKIDNIFSKLDFDWGLCGSLGFELATKLQVANNHSDIDLIVYIADKQHLSKLTFLWEMLQKVPFKTDVQIESPLGAVALYEWMHKPKSLLVKTENGPILCQDPWLEIVNV